MRSALGVRHPHRRNLFRSGIALLAFIFVSLEARAGSGGPQISGLESYYLIQAGTATSICATVTSDSRVTLHWYFNGQRIPHATNACLSFPSIGTNRTGGYFLVASDASGAVTSTVAQVDVANSFWLGVWPTATPLAGQDVMLQLYFDDFPVASSVPVKWFHNGRQLRAHHGSALALTAVTTNDGGEYYVIVDDPLSGRHRIDAQTISVIEAAAPALTSPASLVWNVTAGEKLQFSARAVAGLNVGYRWTMNGTNIPGATNAALLFENVTTNDAGAYELIATNSFGKQHLPFTATVKTATTLDDWTWLSPLPQGVHLRSIAYGRGRFVAVGNSGNIVVSEDGAQWQAVRVPIAPLYGVYSIHFRNVVFGNGAFYAAADYGMIFKSTDGLDWHFVSPTGSWINGLALANGRLVANGNESDIYILKRDDEWQRQAGGFNHVFAAGNQFFDMHISGTGWPYDADFDPGTSYDAKHWRWGTRIHGTNTGYGFIGIARGQKFVGVSYPGTIFTSDHGRNWTQTAFLTNEYVSFVTASPKLYVIGTFSDSIFTSPDARTWTRADTDAGVGLDAMTYAEGKFVGVGFAGTIVSSPNGVQWTRLVDNSIDLYGIAEGNGLIVVAGDHGTILTSTDGQQWTRQQTGITNNLHDVTFANGIFVAVGGHGQLLTSTDAITWTPHATGTPFDLQRVTYAQDKWIAVGEHDSAVTSIDGVNWAPLTIPAFAIDIQGHATTFTPDLEGITYANGLWVVASGYDCADFPLLGCSGKQSMLFTSTNGTDWQQIPTYQGVRLRDVTSGNGWFVAVGNDGLVMTSQNGVNWSSGLLGNRNNFRRVIFADGQFIAVGNNGACVSTTDPTFVPNWVNHQNPNSQNLHSVHQRGDGHVIVVGNNQAILQTR